MEDISRFSTAGKHSCNLDVVKMLNDKLRYIRKAKDMLQPKKCEAKRICDENGRLDASGRSNKFRMSRHLLSSRGNAFLDPSGTLRLQY